MSKVSKIKKEYELAKKAAAKIAERRNDFTDLAYARMPAAKGFKSRVSTGDLSNLIIERNARVAAKAPTGKIIPLSSDDNGKAAALNLAWSNYVLRNANWQYPMSIKLRMWDYYSLAHGISVMFHGYRVDSKYTGPDCRLVDLSFVFPQAGRLSPSDAEYVFYETFHTKEDLKKMLNIKGWNKKNLQNLIDGKNNPSLDANQTSSFQSSRGEDQELFAGMVKLITKYQKGYKSPWITFDEAGNEIRRIENPFKSGRIPFVFKLSFPLIDSFWGLGDVERGESLQLAINSITNLGMDYLKTAVFPPITYSSGMKRSQIQFKPAGAIPINRAGGEFIEQLQVSQAPANIVQQLNQGFKGALMNQNGTTDTTITQETGLPGFGKTPAALEKLDARESSRDNFDRQMFEAACQELFEGMLEEFGTRQKVPIEFDIFEKEIAELEASGYAGDGLTKINKDYAKFKITAKDLQGGYKFIMDVGSSAENNAKEEYERIKGVIEMVEGPFGQKAIEEMEKRGETVDYKLLFEQFLSAANVKNREQVIVPALKTEDQPQEQPPAEQPNPYDYSEDFSESMIVDPNLQKLLNKGV